MSCLRTESLTPDCERVSAGSAEPESCPPIPTAPQVTTGRIVTLQVMFVERISQDTRERQEDPSDFSRDKS